MAAAKTAAPEDDDQSWCDVGSGDEDDEIQALQAQLALLTSASEGSPHETDLEADNERLQQQVAHLSHDSATTDSASSTACDQDQLSQIREHNLKLQQALAEGDADIILALDVGIQSGTGSDITAVLAASQARRSAMNAKRASHGSMAAMKVKASSAAAALDARKKGVDIVFLVDITGSMNPHLAEMLEHTEKIFEAASAVHPEAVKRVAFVGYRDIEDADRFRILDFVDNANEFRLFLLGVEANGNGHDNRCEDMTGGLQEVLKLSWHSSTRVLVHLADYPCHGRQYHDYEDAQHDAHMDGDPSGLVPEQLVQQLAAKKIDYNFGVITSDTRKMADIFSKAYAGCQATFTMRSARDPAADFVPLLLNSISSSMGRSSFFCKTSKGSNAAAEAAIKLGRSDDKPSFLTPLLR